MENLKINTKTLCKISKMINKMGISSLIMKLKVETGNEKEDREEIVKELIALVIDNAYKVEDEIIEFIADIKGITPEEAANEDVIEIIKELLKIEKFKDFLKLA